MLRLITLPTPAILATCAAILLLFAAIAHAQVALPNGFVDQPVVADLNYPTRMAFLPDGRLLFIQRSGEVMLIRNGLQQRPPVGFVNDVRVSFEQGLLGIAVDPQWPARPYLYLYYDSMEGPFIRLSRYTVTGDLDDTDNGKITFDDATRYDVLIIPDTNPLHNSGNLEFAPDGTLYVSIGDDMLPCDAQIRASFRGKILRLDVSSLPESGPPPPFRLLAPPDNPFAGEADSTARLVWAYGLRNPYSFKIDGVKRTVVIGDVGYYQFEELDFASQPGMNFGWPLLEGPIPLLDCWQPDTLSGLSKPIEAYDRTEFIWGAAIMCAGVYRAPYQATRRFPYSYEGDIFYSDYSEGFLRRLHYQAGAWVPAAPVPGQPDELNWGLDFDGVVDYRIAKDGSIWYCKVAESNQPWSGAISRIVYTPTVTVEDPLRSADALQAPTPSPFRDDVTIAWTQATAGVATVSVMDLAGRRIRRLESRWRPAGGSDVVWDGRDDRGVTAPPGLYLIRLDREGRSLAVRAVKIQ